MMKESLTFLICEKCGNLVELVHDAGVPIQCCGAPMRRLEINRADTAREKHAPVVKVDGTTVLTAVGENPHPMSEEHSITWVILETSQGLQRKALTAEDAPAVDFALTAGEVPLAVYSYCNLHGLWRTEVELEEEDR